MKVWLQSRCLHCAKHSKARLLSQSLQTLLFPCPPSSSTSLQTRGLQGRVLRNDCCFHRWRHDGGINLRCPAHLTQMWPSLLQLLRWPWSHSSSLCSWGWVTPVVLDSVLSLPWITVSDLHTAISGMLPGWSPYLLKVTLIHFASHWWDYVFIMCFLTSSPIHQQHPAPIPDLYHWQPLGFGVFSSAEHAPRGTWGSEAEGLHPEKHQRSGFILRFCPKL